MDNRNTKTVYVCDCEQVADVDADNGSIPPIETAANIPLTLFETERMEILSAGVVKIEYDDIKLFILFMLLYDHIKFGIYWNVGQTCLAPLIMVFPFPFANTKPLLLPTDICMPSYFP
jgi:hypothetical protein